MDEHLVAAAILVVAAAPLALWARMAQSGRWIDVIVLFSVFSKRIPFIRFFTKQELLWIPLLGMALLIGITMLAVALIRLSGTDISR